jgi:AmmeMemoRadiSam system protein A
MIDFEVQQRLLQLARLSLEASVRRHATPFVPRDLVISAFGVFVTIHHRGDLRGCLGSLDCADSILESLVRLAGAVAVEDHRFTPLCEHELPDTSIDLSLLTLPELVIDHRTIDVGRHGLIVEHGRRRGLLLPQVASEHGWDRQTFLAHTCIKAGLPPDAWQRGAAIARFEAEVFREEACDSAQRSGGSPKPTSSHDP